MGWWHLINDFVTGFVAGSGGLDYNIDFAKVPERVAGLGLVYMEKGYGGGRLAGVKRLSCFRFSIWLFIRSIDRTPRLSRRNTPE